MMYTQVLVNGYWVVIDAAGQNYDFRVGNRAASFCARQARAILPRKRARASPTAHF